LETKQVKRRYVLRKGSQSLEKEILKKVRRKTSGRGREHPQACLTNREVVTLGFLLEKESESIVKGVVGRGAFRSVNQTGKKKGGDFAHLGKVEIEQ